MASITPPGRIASRFGFGRGRPWEIFGPSSEGCYLVHDDKRNCPNDQYAGVESQRWGELDSIPDLVKVLFGGKDGIWNGELHDYASYQQKLTVFPCVPLPEDTPPTALQILDRLTFIQGAITFSPW